MESWIISRSVLLALLSEFAELCLFAHSYYVIIQNSVKLVNFFLAGLTGIEPITFVSKTKMISISPKPDLVSPTGIEPVFET